ncbi:MAG: hypothetical protein ACI4T1_03230 [Christensenellales bacterium]
MIMMNLFNNSINRNNEEPGNSLQQNNYSNKQSFNEGSLKNNHKDIYQEDKQVKAKISMDFETLQKARNDLMGEIQAIIEYDNHIHNTSDRLAKETWQNIKSEELTHVGELLGLLNYLDPSQREFVEAGLNEFLERMN